MSRAVRAHSSEVREEYFQWLCGLVQADDPDHSYWGLMDILFNTEFIWSVDNDDNRAGDGLELRVEFEDLTGEEACKDEPCSVLEMLIGLADRMDFALSNPGDRQSSLVVWFWEMLENLGLASFEDEDFFGRRAPNRIHFILDRWLNRRYGYSGEGGLFPLREPYKDQRKTEIWYQMQAYLLENFSF